MADFTPEAMADLCGVDPETIRSVARLYAGARAAMIFWGMGISQHVHGTDNARCLIALALVTGQVGPPGHRPPPVAGAEQRPGSLRRRPHSMFYPDYLSVEEPGTRRRFEDVWDMALDQRRGLTVMEIMDAVHAGQIKGIYIMGENPAMSDPDVQHAREGLAKLEHLVVQEIFLTETAFHADVVLPASAWPEKVGTVTNSNRQVQMGRAALQPPRRRAAGLVDHPGTGAPHGVGLELCRTGRRLRGDEARHAVPGPYHLGAGGA